MLGSRPVRRSSPVSTSHLDDAVMSGTKDNSLVETHIVASERKSTDALNHHHND